MLRVAAYEKEAEGFVTAPLEPLEEVYYALAELKGAVPAKKLALLLTTTGSGWKDGRRESRVDAEEIAGCWRTSRIRSVIIPTAMPART